MPRSSLSSRARLAVLPWLPKARVGLLLSPPSLSPSTPRATTLQTTLHLLRCPSASCCVGADVECLPPAVPVLSLFGGGGPMMLRQHTYSASFLPLPVVAGISSSAVNFNRKPTHFKFDISNNMISTSPPFVFFGPGVVDKKAKAVGVWFRERTEEKAAQQLGLSPRDTQGRQAFTDRVERRTDHER